MSRSVIGELMDARGLKPTPFARRVGVKTSTMFSIYKGETSFGKIGVEHFVAIAHGLGMTADELWEAGCGGSERHDDITQAEAEVMDVLRRTRGIDYEYVKNFILFSSQNQRR